MSCARSCRFAQSGLCSIPRHEEILPTQVRAGLLRVLPEPSVDRCEPLLSSLAAFCLDSVEFSAIAQLPGTQVCGNASDPLLHILAAQTQRLAVISPATDHHVNMRMLGVVMLNCDPFE